MASKKLAKKAGKKVYTSCPVVDVQKLGEDRHQAIDVFREWFQFKDQPAKDVAYPINFSGFFYTDEHGRQQRNTKDYEAHYFELYDLLAKHVPKKILHGDFWFYLWW